MNRILSTGEPIRQTEMREAAGGCSFER